MVFFCLFQARILRYEGEDDHDIEAQATHAEVGTRFFYLKRKTVQFFKLIKTALNISSLPSS